MSGTRVHGRRGELDTAWRQGRQNANHAACAASPPTRPGHPRPTPGMKGLPTAPTLPASLSVCAGHHAGQLLFAESQSADQVGPAEKKEVVRWIGPAAIRPVAVTRAACTASSPVRTLCLSRPVLSMPWEEHPLGPPPPPPPPVQHVDPPAPAPSLLLVHEAGKPQLVSGPASCTTFAARP